MSSIRSQRATASRASAAPATTVTRRASEPGSRLADLGVYGFDRHEATILVARVTEDPLLVVGCSGTGKTLLLSTLSEALDLALANRQPKCQESLHDDLKVAPYRAVQQPGWVLQSPFDGDPSAHAAALGHLSRQESKAGRARCSPAISI